MARTTAWPSIAVPSSKGELDVDVRPADRVTPDRVKRFAQGQLSRIASVTVSSAVIGLKVVVQAMDPDRDWRWLKTVSNRLHTSARPTPRTGPDPASTRIVEAAIRELDRLLTTPLDRRIERVAYRDGLMVLILAICPVRLRNLTMIEVGRHLVPEAGRWTLRFRENETKTRQRLAFELPPEVDRYLAVYLDRIRPSFSPAVGCTRLWLGFEGQPISDKSIAYRITLTTERLLGRAINPHRFRACAATTLVEERPEHARLAAPLLGHRYFQTTERSYIRANQLLASRKVGAILGQMVKKARKET